MLSSGCLGSWAWEGLQGRRRAGGRLQLMRVWGEDGSELLQHHSMRGVADSHAVEAGNLGGAQRRVLLLLGLLLTVLESFLEYQWASRSFKHNEVTHYVF